MAIVRPGMVYVALIAAIYFGYGVGAATVVASDGPDSRPGE